MKYEECGCENNLEDHFNRHHLIEEVILRDPSRAPRQIRTHYICKLTNKTWTRVINLQRVKSIEVER